MSTKPLIVLDTNVLVSGLRSNRGWSFRILSRIGGDGFTHCVSVPLLCEYEEVLKRMAPTLGLDFAVAAQADRIVTFNVRHFPDAQRFGVAVCTPAEFCTEFGITP